VVFLSGLLLSIGQKIGEEWVVDLYKLQELEQYSKNDSFLTELFRVKQVRDVEQREELQF